MTTGFYKSKFGEKTIDKVDNAVLDYSFNWNEASDPWLESGELIANQVVTVETGLTLDSTTEAGGKVTVVLSGGTPGNVYQVDCKITTDSVPARTDERSIFVNVKGHRP